MSENTSSFTGIAPVFLVRDVVKSAAWYRDVLGFSFDRIYGEPPSFCLPRRDGFILMLGQPKDASKVHPNSESEDRSWSAYVWCKDAEALFKEFKSKGAAIEYEPLIRQLYGMKEFAVRDLDGHILAFGQPWPPADS